MSLLDPESLRSIDAGHFWVLTGFVWAAAITCFIVGWRFLRRLQAVEDTPKSLVRSAAQGYVELSGLCRPLPGVQVIAPLSRVPCAWWAYTVEEYVGSGKNAHWKLVKDEISGEMFYLEDTTGRCVVDAEKAVVYPSARDVWYGNTLMPDGGPGLGVSRFGASFRYSEQRIHDGDPLYALGYFHTQGTVSAVDIDDEVRQQLATWKKDQAWLIQHFDTNHDGQVDPQEWEAARQEARRLVLEREHDNLQRPPVDVLSRPPDGRDFILSALPQGRLESRLRGYALACLLLFLCVGALGTYLLDVRLHS